MEAVAQQTAAAAGCCGGPDAGDLTHIVKGKRTKRQRPHSPIPFTFPTHSPASSSDFPATAEDEDTAKCLILLSQGHSSTNNDDFTPYKFNSKRYIQTAGMYVYECKTCSRTFPSFQALGGHRASHKKPKFHDDRRKPPPYTVVSNDDEPPPPPLRKNYSSSSSSLSLQLNNRVSWIKSSKIHECSICGTEFNSGQALGGHMRRHRVAGGGAAAVIAATNTTTTLALIPFSHVAGVETEDQKSRNDGLCLDLDLNLPAPPDAAVDGGDHGQHHESKFTFSTPETNRKKQQSAVHFSAAPTLVDCHN